MVNYNSRIISLHTYCQKSQKKVQIQSCIKKNQKKILNVVVVFASKFSCVDPHATWGSVGGDICTSSVMCYETYKEEPGVAGVTFDGG